MHSDTSVEYTDTPFAAVSQTSTSSMCTIRYTSSGRLRDRISIQVSSTVVSEISSNTIMEDNSTTNAQNCDDKHRYESICIETDAESTDPSVKNNDLNSLLAIMNAVLNH